MAQTSRGGWSTLQVTSKHVTEMQEYFFSDDFDPDVTVAPGMSKEISSDFAKAQRRLQLRALVLFLATLTGFPELDFLMGVRHVDVKIANFDKNSPRMDVPLDGDRGRGTDKYLLLRAGPDRNGKYIIFSASRHEMDNECCLNALGDLLAYEHNRENPFVHDDVRNWFTDPTDPSPFLFHPPGDPFTPLSRSSLQSEIEAALRYVQAPLPLLDMIAWGAMAIAVDEGGDLNQVHGRTLAPPVPPSLSPLQLRIRKANDYLDSLTDLSNILMTSAAWKLQRFEERWPLASFDFVQRRKSKKFFRKVIRHYNDYDGCAVCGKKRAAGGKPLHKCSKCRTQLYCSRECQVADWKRHKKAECKNILL